MKKIFVLMSVLLLLLAGCNNNENTEFGKIYDLNMQSFSQDELDLIHINVGQSNFSNSMNLKCSIPGKMCYVRETDTLFYSYDDGLFQENGDNVIRLLDEPAISLNFVDGMLYFIIPEGDDNGWIYGKAYRMDMDSGKTERIIEDDISKLSVYSDGIFYLQSTVAEYGDGVFGVATSFFKCALNGEGNEQIDDFSFTTENNLCVSKIDDVVRVKDLQSGTITVVAEEPNMAFNLSIYNNHIYYIRLNSGGSDTAAVVIDLADNSVTEYYRKGAYFEDYGFLDGKLCLYDIGSAFYLLENEGLVKYECSDSYKSIYSCGGKLYGLKPDGKLCELHLEDDNGTKSVSETEIGGSQNEA